jgi:hypothetical protein
MGGGDATGRGSGTVRVLAIAAGVAAIAVACVALALLSGGSARAARSSQRITTGSLQRFHAALVAQLRSEHLKWNWVACVRNGNRFEGVPIVRCNVDFGIDPHVEAYCSVFRGGRLLTNHEDPAIPCSHDNAGYHATIVLYG